MAVWERHGSHAVHSRILKNPSSKKSIKRGKTMKSSTRWKKEKVLASLTDSPETKACRLDITY